MPKTMLYHDILKTVYLDIKVGIFITNMHISAKHKGISVTSNFTENEKFLFNETFAHYGIGNYSIYQFQLLSV